MNKPKQVTEFDLGETLIIQGEKVHVNIDGATIVAENGVLKAVLPADSPITKFELSPTGTLSLGVKGVDQPFTVDLTGLVPAAQADRFLKDVTYDKRAKEFVFTTGAEGQADTTFRVPLSAFAEEFQVKVSAASGNILVMKEDGLYVAAPTSTGGTDLGNIPEKPFVQGSKILAFDAEGNLYQFAQNAAYEKDVSVTVTVTENTIHDDGYNTAIVRVRVANNLSTTATDVTLNVGTSAEISGETTINGLVINGNGSITREYEVRYNTSSHFTATVSVVGDAVSSNNTASVALPFNVKKEPAGVNNVYTDECQQITATVYGEELLSSKMYDKSETSIRDSDQPYIGYEHSPATSLNIINKGDANLGGTTINLLGASRVEVYGMNPTGNGSGAVVAIKPNAEGNGYNGVTTHLFGSDYYDIRPTSSYTFDPVSGDLTFNRDYDGHFAIIFARPASETCKWQVWAVSNGSFNSKHTINQNRYLRVTAPEQYTTWVDVNVTENSSGVPTAYDQLPSFGAVVGEWEHAYKVIGDNLDDRKVIGNGGYWDQRRDSGYLRNLTFNANQKPVIAIPKSALPQTFTVEAQSGYREPLNQTSGNIRVTITNEDEFYNNYAHASYEVTVSAAATATDNIVNQHIEIRIVE